MDPTLHYKMKAEEAYDGFSDGAADPMYTDTRDHGKTRAQKQTVVRVDREHRDGCAS